MDRVENNLVQGKMRLIIAADELRPEMRKIIEFLNNETKTLEILGLEIKLFGDDSDFSVFVPTIVDQSQTTSEKKNAYKNIKLWKFEELKEFFRELDDCTLSERIQIILDWASSCRAFLESRSKLP